jgi:HD-GYP domain-containing protein (c-di-GMP phosphodiesterase class II)
MGVPDAILLSPGPLTDAEWKTMRRHPVYARALLEPIVYLNRALDIPYSHHEKWDGTGYPQGLSGYQIPLAARIFAVADVWDALRSDRPYRPAWSVKKARAHLRQQAGRQFDPAVVDKFLELLDRGALPESAVPESAAPGADPLPPPRAGAAADEVAGLPVQTAPDRA